MRKTKHPRKIIMKNNTLKKKKQRGKKIKIKKPRKMKKKFSLKIKKQKGGDFDPQALTSIKAFVKGMNPTKSLFIVEKGNSKCEGLNVTNVSGKQFCYISSMNANSDDNISKNISLTKNEIQPLPKEDTYLNKPMTNSDDNISLTKNENQPLPKEDTELKNPMTNSNDNISENISLTNSDDNISENISLTNSDDNISENISLTETMNAFSNKKNENQPLPKEDTDLKNPMTPQSNEEKIKSIILEKIKTHNKDLFKVIEKNPGHVNKIIDDFKKKYPFISRTLFKYPKTIETHSDKLIPFIQNIRVNLTAKPTTSNLNSVFDKKSMKTNNNIKTNTEETNNNITNTEETNNKTKTNTEKTNNSTKTRKNPPQPQASLSVHNSLVPNDTKTSTGVKLNKKKKRSMSKLLKQGTHSFKATRNSIVNKINKAKNGVTRKNPPQPQGNLSVYNPLVPNRQTVKDETKNLVDEVIE